MARIIWQALWMRLSWISCIKGTPCSSRQLVVEFERKLNNGLIGGKPLNALSRILTLAALSTALPLALAQ